MFSVLQLSEQALGYEDSANIAPRKQLGNKLEMSEINASQLSDEEASLQEIKNLLNKVVF